MKKTLLLGLTTLAAAQTQGLCAGNREFDLKFSKSKITVDAETKDKEAKCKDDLEITFDIGSDGARVRFDYKAKNDTAKSKFHVRQNVFRVVEFNDANNNNVIDDGEEVQTLKLNKWDDLTKADSTQDGTTVSNMKGTLEAGWFKVSTRYAGSPITYLAQADDADSKKFKYALNPASIKIDYIVHNFPYQSNNTKIALDGRFKSKAKFHEKRKRVKGTPRPDKKEEQEFETSNDTGMGARFSWVTTVDADGTDVPVVAYIKNDPDEKVEDNESNRRMVWVFDTTKKVTKFIWDPELSANQEEDVTSGAVALAGGLFAGLLAFFA